MKKLNRSRNMRFTAANYSDGVVCAAWFLSAQAIVSVAVMLSARSMSGQNLVNFL
jgi:hypothetical protein